MDPDFEQHLRKRLEEWRSNGLYRRIREVSHRKAPATMELGGRTVVDFSSNDYLGLAAHRGIQEAAAQASGTDGMGSRASRLISGSLESFRRLEDSISQWKRREAAIYFSSGYQTGVSLFSAIAEKGDMILLDRLIHACLIDGARLAGCPWRTFRHNCMADLERKLEALSKDPDFNGRVFVATEGLFSMDGDEGDLRGLVELKRKYPFVLVVDEAHSGGITGPCGRGLAAREDVESRVDISMGTCGKAMGVAGGYVAGSSTLIEWLKQRARGWMFSTAPPPAIAAALLKSIEILSSGEGDRLRRKLLENISAFHASMGTSGPSGSPIIPYIVGDEKAAIDLQERILGHGYFVGAVRYPAVPKSRARLRITLSAAHSREQILGLTATLRKLGSQPGI